MQRSGRSSHGCRTHSIAADRVGCTAHGSDHVNLNSGTADRPCSSATSTGVVPSRRCSERGMYPQPPPCAGRPLFGCAPQGRLPSGARVPHGGGRPPRSPGCRCGVAVSGWQQGSSFNPVMTLRLAQAVRRVELRRPARRDRSGLLRRRSRAYAGIVVVQGAMAVEPAHPPAAMMRVSNPVMRALLRSPAGVRRAGS